MTYANGNALNLYFSSRILNGQYRVIDDSGNGYGVIGCKYDFGSDQIFLEIDPNDYRENAGNCFHYTTWFSLKPTKIIFNGPATIVFWDDGTKTVVKCTERETFDYEKGVALCYMKKLLGNDNSFKHVFKKFNIPKQYRGYDDHYIEKLMDKEYFMKVLKSNFRKA